VDGSLWATIPSYSSYLPIPGGTTCMHAVIDWLSVKSSKNQAKTKTTAGIIPPTVLLTFVPRTVILKARMTSA
jgi:hypothetical protein